ncbi:hypothetical protein ACROYT_G033888 [Oculina patagonica]
MFELLKVRWIKTNQNSVVPRHPKALITSLSVSLKAFQHAGLSGKKLPIANSENEAVRRDDR